MVGIRMFYAINQVVEYPESDKWLAEIKVVSLFSQTY